MSEKWVDERISTRASRTPWHDERITPEIPHNPHELHCLMTPEEYRQHSQEVLAPERTPEQIAASTEQTVFENQRDVAKLQAQLDELRVELQEQNAQICVNAELANHNQDGGRHLAERIDKVEAKSATQNENSRKRDTELSGRIGGLRKKIHKVFVGTRNQIDANMAHVQARLNRLEHQAKRVREQFPQVDKPTIQEQCAATEPQEEGDDETG